MERFKKKFRHELKYIVDERDIALIENRLSDIMALDQHNLNGAYQIASVYFDDYDNSALMQNINGVSPREKYRIRIYDRDGASIFLERKTKNFDLTYKESSLLSLEECNDLINCRYHLNKAENSDLLAFFKTEAVVKRMQPKIIVLYERTAYTCPDGNVRITFDRNLSSSTQIKHFLTREPLLKRPIMPIGKHIMEVKYDEFLPRYIKECLNSGKMERITYSKYTLCRQFAGQGICLQ